MKINDFLKLVGNLDYDKKKKAVFGTSENEITDFGHSENSNFKIGDRVKKINALDNKKTMGLYETPNETRGIMLSSIFIDELEAHICLVKFENLEDIVATKEDKLELVN